MTSFRLLVLTHQVPSYPQLDNVDLFEYPSTIRVVIWSQKWSQLVAKGYKQFTVNQDCTRIRASRFASARQYRRESHPVLAVKPAFRVSMDLSYFADVRENDIN